MSKYTELLERANVHSEDKERKAALYIISNIPELFDKKEKFYDFEENYMKDISSVSGIDLLDSEVQMMLKIAYCFFSNNSYKVDFLTAFSYLGLKEYEILKRVIEMTWDFKETEEVYNPVIPNILN